MRTHFVLALDVGATIFLDFIYSKPETVFNVLALKE
jgi:hypothetical protein